jgi:predicted secreted hydrolase
MRPVSVLRRAMLLAPISAQAAQAIPVTQTAQVTPRALIFPRDHGSHPEFRTEWWYLTGHFLAGAQAFGFQVTFFRSRVDGSARGAKASLAAEHVVFAHAALTDVGRKTHAHSERIARFNGLSQPKAAVRCEEGNTNVALGNWNIVRQTDGSYSARVQHTGDHPFELDLQLTPTQELLLQGKQGVSQKGPDASQASYYYSQPQLKVSGTVKAATSQAVDGVAWLDHEWSETLLHPEAVGWDWIGINMTDGGALTAFQLRRADGSALWAGGSYRSTTPTRNPKISQQITHIASPAEVQFKPGRVWKSPYTQAAYPVEWQVRTPADVYSIKPVLDAQEMGGKNGGASVTGTIYWEGLVDCFASNGQLAGRGYLEMTGYARAMRI